ncbi:MAG: hypothetical protein HY613_08345 [Candidatus Rokubacteria bacterium]|nr:hypothetical protein [Candidatus Rokubacteria bacterium]
MVELVRPPVILDILHEHLNELDFLWEQRERFVFSPEWTLKELAAIEDRSEAHLDGLRIGAGHSVDIARPFLTADEAGAATAATFVLMAFELPELEREVLQALKTAPPKSRDGIRIGLRHSPVDSLVPCLSDFVRSYEPQVSATAVDILAFHRLPCPSRLGDLLICPDPHVKRIIYGAVGRLGGPWNTDLLHEALADPDPALADVALGASALLGVPNLAAICRRAAVQSSQPSAAALAFLGVVGEPSDLALLRGAIAHRELAPAALTGLGALGIPEGIPLILETLAVPRLAQQASEAFTRITGASLQLSAAPVTSIDEGVSGKADETEDETLRDGPSSFDIEDARSWWDREKKAFAAGVRYQAGFPVDTAQLGKCFHLLPLRSRQNLYYRERALHPERCPDLELEQRSNLQRSLSPV